MGVVIAVGGIQNIALIAVGALAGYYVVAHFKRTGKPF